MGLSELTASAINEALDEFDRIGRDAFLKRYGMGAARGYYLLRKGHRYDSKAIAAAAHGKLAGLKPLRASEFSGGDKTVARHFRKLGFETVGPKDHERRLIPFERGKLYHRQRDIHQLFGGQEQGGICTPEGVPFVFLFTGQSGGQYGYEDTWCEDGTFSYTGEGRRGNMQFVRGNKAVREHLADGRDLLLFEQQPVKGMYRYLGCFACSGWDYRTAVDTDGVNRQAIAFRLVPAEVREETPPNAQDNSPARSIDELRTLALAAAEMQPGTGNESVQSYYRRSATVRAYVLARAKGACESCRKPAPFRRTNGEPYLEPHHTRRLGDGGPDHPRWVGAVCPTCHREIHHGERGAELNRRLEAYLGRVEAEPDDHALSHAPHSPASRRCRAEKLWNRNTQQSNRGG
jgi:5-methylcytosine-specific restriction enzyme A